MSNRARQLLLELLLLSERYSERDVQWVRKELAQHGKGFVMADLLGLLPKDPGKPAKPSASKEPLAARNANDVAKSLLDQLRNDRSIKRVRQAEAMAQRLDIKLSGQSHGQLVDEIDRKLKSLDEGALVRFLKPYKKSVGADEGYVGLANFIMKGSD